MMISMVSKVSISASARMLAGAAGHFPSAVMVSEVVSEDDSGCNVAILWSFFDTSQDLTMKTSPIEIVCYLKTYCGWSEGVRAILRKYDLEFEEKDIIKNPAFRWEMEQKSGQPMSPCVVVNGQMLADVSGDEVEQYLVEEELVEKFEEPSDAPTDSGCVGH